MPDPSATRHYQLMNQLDKLGTSIAEHLGIDPALIMKGLRDVVQLEERIEPFDFLEGFVNGVNRPLPTVGHLTDTMQGVFYAGKINVLFGDDSAGKSLLTDMLAVQEVRSGRGVLILECEEHDPSSRQERWIQMSDGYRRIQPSDVTKLTVWPITQRPTPNMLKAFIDRIAEANVSMVVIDSLSDLMGKYGLEENNASDVRQVENALLKPLAKTGAAVVVIDHTAKSSDGKTARGSIVKRNLVSGVAYQLCMPDGHEFDRETAGFSVLVTRKDRLGNYRRHKSLAVMHVNPAELNGGFLDIQLLSDPTIDLDNMKAGEELQPASPRTLEVANGDRVSDEDQLTRIHDAIQDAQTNTHQGPTGERLRKDLGVTETEFRRLIDIGRTRGWWARNKANRWVLTASA